jgi:hypothetical protein
VQADRVADAMGAAQDSVANRYQLDAVACDGKYERRNALEPPELMLLMTIIANDRLA